MKITSKEEYEENHESLKEVSDEFLYDLFNSVKDLYDRLSAEIAYRISKTWKVQNQ